MIRHALGASRLREPVLAVRLDQALARVYSSGWHVTWVHIHRTANGAAHIHRVPLASDNDTEHKAHRQPKPWLKAEVGQFCVFGAGVDGCNGLLSPTEYSGNGQVVLYMGEQGAIIFREQEGWLAHESTFE